MEEAGKKSIDIVLVSNGNAIDDDLIYHRYAKYLNQNGYHVTVIGVDCGYALPEDGIDFIRLFPPKNRLYRFTVRLREIKQICKRLAIHKPTFMLCTIDLCGMGIDFAQKGIPIIQVFFENYKYKIMGKAWIPLFLRSFVRDRMLHKQIVLANACVSNIFVDQNTKNDYMDKIRKPCFLLPNYPILLSENSVYPGKIFDHRPLKMVYVGAISHERGLDSMVRLAQALGNEVELHLYGSSSESDFQQWIDLSSNVYYHGQIPYTDVLRILPEYDLGLFFPKKGNTFDYCGENATKVFEYMFAGLPVFCTDIKGLRRIIEDESGSGRCFPIENMDEAIKSIRQLLLFPEELGKMAENGWLCARQKYNWHKIVDGLYQAVECSVVK